MNVRKCDCPCCARKDVEGFPEIGFLGKAGYTLGGFAAGCLTGQPWCAVAGAVAGAGVARHKAKNFKFKCPNCRHEWVERF